MAVKSNRTVESTTVVKVPAIFTEENRGFIQCCEPLQMLFDATDSISWKNDCTSAWSLGDTVTFVLKKDGVVTNYTPLSIAFPNEPNAYYCTIEWRDVYFLDGQGCFQLYVSVDYAGLNAEKLWGDYLIEPYSINTYILAKNTVRLKSIFNDVNNEENINFTGANVVDCLRFKGKFGYWNPLTEVDNILFTDDEKVKVKREDLTEFELRVDLHGEAIIDRLRFHLLAENVCYISDHNPDNYSYKYLDYPVIVKSGFEPNWIDATRKVKGVAKFEDKQKRTRTHFQDNDNTGEFVPPTQVCLPAVIDDNGATIYVPSGQSYTCGMEAPDGTVENSDLTYTTTVASGGTLVLPDSQVNVNSVNEGSVVSVKTIDVNITDGVDPVTPDSVALVGNTLTVTIPTSGGYTSAQLNRTDQTISYRTGDDGDLEEGRDTDFLTLATNNIFGNTYRFTDELGGQTFTNDWVVDWATYNGSTVLGYYRVPQFANTSGWNEAIDNCVANTYGTFSGCRLPNVMEVMNIIRWSTATNGAGDRGYSYVPFNLADDYTYWSSTSYYINTLQAYHTRALTKYIGVSNKTVIIYYYMPVRNFTVTGTTLS